MRAQTTTEWVGNMAARRTQSDNDPTGLARETAGIVEQVLSDDDASTDSGRPKKAPRKRSVAPSRTKATKYNWAEIEAWYVEGQPITDDETGKTEYVYPSLTDIHDRYGVSQSTVSERSSKGRWPEKRAAFQKRVQQDRQRARINELSREAIDLDSKAITAAKLGINIATVRMAEISRSQTEQARKLKELRDSGFPVSKDDLKPAVYGQELDALSRAASTFYDIGRKALGEDVQRHEVDVSGDVSATVSIDVRDEMGRDDMDRMADILRALEEARVIGSGAEELKQIASSQDIEDAEVVEDEVDDPLGESA